jgi:D-alanyl-D-alanine carboxypeptidase
MNTHSRAAFSRRRLAFGALGMAAVLGAATACASSDTKHGAIAPTAALDSLAQQLVDDGVPGVIVRVDDGHGSAIQIAHQAAWTGQDRVLSPQDQFRVGSNTKTMVAALVLQLVAAHTLSLDDSVQKRLPGMIPNGSAITIRMLLDHTSGLYNYLDDPRILKVFTGRDTRTWTPQELLAAAVSHPPLFAPGAEYSYSNTNYVALGLILQEATGQSLANLIQNRIAKPLGLTGTYLAPYTPDPANRKLADGYEPDAAKIAPLLFPGTPAGTSFAGPARGDFVNTTWINDSGDWAAGGIVSTAADWAKFQAALVTGKLFPQSQVKQMETTVSEGSQTQNRYGLGLEHVVTPCGDVWGHDGQAAGYSTWTYTDDTGTRTVGMFVTTIFGLAEPKTSAASQTLLNAAVCAMLDKPIPAGTTPTPTASVSPQT